MYKPQKITWSLSRVLKEWKYPWILKLWIIINLDSASIVKIKGNILTCFVGWGNIKHIWIYTGLHKFVYDISICDN